MGRNLVEYRAGNGPLAIDGAIEVTGTMQDFGKVGADYWRTWGVPYGCLQLRHPSMFDPNRAAADRYLVGFATAPNDGDQLDAAAVTAFWSRYPDVAGDSYSGLGGPLGISDASRHFREDGRCGGRPWR